MDFGQVITFVTLLSQGGPAAVIALLLMGLVYFYRENVHLKATIAEKEKKIDQIVDDYYRGNMTLAEALNSLKSILFEIKSRF